MYTSFYGLSKKPFRSEPDPDFLWLGENHREALSTLRYGILENKGFLLLTGAGGTGKTTLISSLSEGLDENILFAVISDPRQERIQFYNSIARSFGLEDQFTSKVQFLIQFSHFLHSVHDNGKKVLLVVDDCHLLSQEMLEELRLLSNIEKGDAKLINIFFVGQRVFNDMLVQPENRAVRQRLTLKAELSPLSKNETEEYIRHRLTVADGQDALLSVKAMQLIHKYSQGVPHTINLLCERLLISGAKAGMHSIDHKFAGECLQQVDLSSPHMQDGLSDSGLVGPREISEPDDPQTVVSGINLEDEPSWGWLKYVGGFVVLVVAVSYFWMNRKIPDMSAPAPPAVVENTAVAQVKKDSLSGIGDSPAVTVLGSNERAMNAGQAAKLKSAILEKAYNPPPTPERKPLINQENVPVTAVSGPEEGDTDVAEPVATQAKMEQPVTQPVTPAVTENVTTVPELQLPENVGVAEAQGTVSPLVAEETVLPAVAEVLPPMEPRKVVLPLQANSTRLTRVARRNLARFLEKLAEYPRATLMVKGFVSSKTNSPENILLSEQRAETLMKILVKKGIDPERIELKGMGNQEPIASNNTYEGRRQNRRVEIVVVDDGIIK